MRILYTPSGRAREYGEIACNPYTGCGSGDPDNPAGCRYCFVPAALHMSREYFHAGTVRKANVLQRLEHDCRIVHNEPIFLSFATDIYQPFSNPATDITREVIQTIKGSGNRVRILTKGGRIAQRDLDLLGPEDEFGVTLTFRDELRRAEWEPRAGSTMDRILNLKHAKELGIPTWASFEPVIDPEQTLALMATPLLDRIMVGKANHIENWDWPSDEWRRRVESIDWVQFRDDVTNLADDLGLPCYIKRDLAECGPRMQVEVSR